MEESEVEDIPPPLFRFGSSCISPTPFTFQSPRVEISSLLMGPNQPHTSPSPNTSTTLRFESHGPPTSSPEPNLDRDGSDWEMEGTEASEDDSVSAGSDIEITEDTHEGDMDEANRTVHLKDANIISFWGLKKETESQRAAQVARDKAQKIKDDECMEMEAERETDSLRQKEREKLLKVRQQTAARVKNLRRRRKEAQAQEGEATSSKKRKQVSISKEPISQPLTVCHRALTTLRMARVMKLDLRKLRDLAEGSKKILVSVTSHRGGNVPTQMNPPKI